MKYYQLSFDQIEKFNFLGGVFSLDRITPGSENIIFHFIQGGADGYTVLASNEAAIKFAEDNNFTESQYSQNKNIKLNEVATEALKIARHLIRRPGDDALISNNSDLTIEMVLLLKELFLLVGLPVDYWKQFLLKFDKKAGSKIRRIITENVTFKFETKYEDIQSVESESEDHSDETLDDLGSEVPMEKKKNNE